jgi:ABC-type sugar transport system substrate-binding protein
MKRTPLVLAATVAATVFALSACSSSDSPSDTPSGSSSAPEVVYDGPEGGLPTAYGEPEKQADYSFTIGWLAPTLANSFVKAVHDAGKAETERLGGEFIGLDAELNPDNQVSQCNQLVAQGVDAIAVYPVNPDALGPCLEEAVAKGIQIIGEDTPPQAGEPLLPGYASAVLQGIDQPRYLTAQAAAELAPGAEFATIGVDIPVPLLQYSIEQVKYWAEEFELQFAERVDSQGDSSEAAADATNTILTRNPDVKIIFAYNDAAAAAAANTLLASGITDVQVWGITGAQSTIDLIGQDGGVTGTVLLDADQVGIQQVWGLYDLLTGQNLPLAPQINPTPILVTEENAADVVGIAG